MPAFVPRIVDRHAEEAAFLWSLRDAAADHSSYTLHHLANLETRLDAHLDGLRVAEDAGFETAGVRFARARGSGELFVVAALALEGRVEPRIESAFAFAEAAPEARRGLLGALGWAPPGTLRGQVVRWLDASSSFRRLAGVVACSLHRADPGASLERLLADDTHVRARTLRLAGELGRSDLRQRVGRALGDEDAACRFWAAWSTALLGDRESALPVLKVGASAGSSFQLNALDLVVRLLDLSAARGWLREFGRDPAHARLLVIATGVLGDPAAVPWLIERMSVPALARVAGESFSLITGRDLVEDELDASAPAGFMPQGNEEVRDENLPWPDPMRVQRWWDREATRFTSGIRHLAGRPLTTDVCDAVLRDGQQHQRRAAACELALRNPGRPLWNWRARSDIQARWLRTLAAKPEGLS